jgi:GNAT superfamily N-acetyltransferase
MHTPTVIQSISIESLTDSDAISAVIPDLARLRIGVFREFPYLYDGSLDYEAEHLKLYAKTAGAVVVTARDGASNNRVIGAATALPLAHAHAELLAAFKAASMPIEDIYYCAESVLEPAYRGRGIGHAFFDHRERQAVALGFGECCFLSVIRAEDHKRQPPGYRPHDAFWTKRGYAKVSGFQASFSWCDLDEAEASPKAMALWQRALP